jgi:hypothetical protein
MSTYLSISRKNKFDLLGKSLGLSTLFESVLSLAGHRLEVSHAASASSSLPLGLRGPSNVTTGLGGGVPARGAGGLLLVERHLAATTAAGVGLSLPLSE